MFWHSRDISVFALAAQCSFKFGFDRLPTNQGNLMSMLSKEEETEVSINWEDQSNINSFSRLNHSLEITSIQLTEQRKRLELLADLSDEMELVDVYFLLI